MGRYTSGASSSSVGTVPHQAPVLAADDFVAGNIIFNDTKQQLFQKIPDMTAPLAVIAGPGTQSIASPYASATAASGAYLPLADGSFVCAVIGQASSTYQLDVLRYNKRGVLQNRVTLVAASSTNLSAPVLAPLSNGNIAVGWTSNVGNVNILTPGLQPLLTSPSVFGNATLYLQETNNGGVIVLGGGAGFRFLSAAGVATTITAANPIAGSALASQTLLNDDNGNEGNPRTAFQLSNTTYNFAPLQISNGTFTSPGFQFTYFEGNPSSSLNAVQINPDGTLRAGPAVLASHTAQSPAYAHVARDPITGNIAYGYTLVSNAGQYGIVSDTLVSIKNAASTNAFTDNNQDFRLVPEMAPASAGAFTFLGAVSSNATALYLTAAGAIKSGFPKNLGATAGAGTLHLYPLTTGTSAVWLGTASTYSLQHAWTDLTGASTTKTLYSFGTGNAGTLSGATIYNDTVYGAANPASSSSNCDLVAFTVPNTGVPDATPVYIGATPSANPVKVLMDASNQAFNVIVPGHVTTLGASDKRFIQDYALAAITPNGKLYPRAYGLAFFDQVSGGAYGPGASANVGVQLVKSKSTIIHGVAAASGAKGSLVTMNSKGLFSTDFTGYAGNFDHSANNPPGAKGWINSGTIELLGYQ